MAGQATGRILPGLRFAAVVVLAGWLAFGLILTLNSCTGRIAAEPFASATVSCGGQEIVVAGYTEVRRAPNIGLERFFYRLQARSSEGAAWRVVLEEWQDEPLENLRERLRSQGGTCLFFTPRSLVVMRPNGEWADRTEAVMNGAHVPPEGRLRHQVSSVSIGPDGTGQLVLAESDGETVRLETNDFGATWRGALR